jgi:type I restriction enzyme, S subunit
VNVSNLNSDNQSILWRSATLSDVCRLINGRAYKKAELLDEGKYKVLRVGNFFTNRSWYYSDLELDDDKYCDDGDLLYAWSASFGPRLWQGGKSIYHYHIWKVDIDNYKVNKDFLFYWFNWDVDKIKAEQGAGTTMIHVTKGAMEKRELLLPPLPEQQRIVSILDEAFTAIDKAIANTEKNLANARELFESYLNNVFTLKGDGWVDKTLGEICENLDSKRIPITKAKRVSGDIPYYGASGIVDHVAEFIFNEPLLLVSEDGANLLARTYPIAFSIDGKTWVNNHAHALRFKSMVTQRFVEYFLNSISLDPYVSGMAQPKLNQKSLNSIMVPLPDLSEQELIISNLARLQTETKKLDDLYKAKVVGLTELKQSILQKAFSGELTSEDIKQQVNG